MADLFSECYEADDSDSAFSRFVKNFNVKIEKAISAIHVNPRYRLLKIRFSPDSDKGFMENDTFFISRSLPKIAELNAPARKFNKLKTPIPTPFWLSGRIEDSKSAVELWMSGNPR